jgi:hypothetical protein
MINDGCADTNSKVLGVGPAKILGVGDPAQHAIHSII